MKFKVPASPPTRRIGGPKVARVAPAAAGRSKPVKPKVRGAASSIVSGPGRRGVGKGIGHSKQAAKVNAQTTAVEKKRGAIKLPATPVRGGFDPGKFAGEVAGNFGRGVDKVAKSVPVLPNIQSRSRAIPGPAQSKANNDALKKALGRK